MTVAAGWRRGSACGNGECVEVAEGTDGLVLVRNSRRPEEVVAFTAAEWKVFAGAFRSGEFDDLG